MLFKTSQEFLLDLLITLSISHITVFFFKPFLYYVLPHTVSTVIYSFDTGNGFLLSHIIWDFTWHLH